MNYPARLVISIVVAIWSGEIMIGALGVNLVGGVITWFAVSFVVFQILPSIGSPTKADKKDSDKRN